MLKVVDRWCGKVGCWVEGGWFYQEEEVRVYERKDFRNVLFVTSRGLTTTTPRQQLSPEEVPAMLGKDGGEVNCAIKTCTVEHREAMTPRLTVTYPWTS